MAVEILSAGYGAGAQWVDVTAKVQEQYQKGQRSFYAENKDYTDPFENAKKILCIVYREDGGYLNTVTADEHGVNIILPN